MKLLITGGAGFIGSHLAEALVARGDTVYCIDDLSTGNIANLDGLIGHPRFRYVVDSFTNEPLLAEWIDRADQVYHLAAAVGVKLIVESPVRTIETNINGTELVLKHAAKKKKKVLLASTSEVYGKSNKVPFCEDDDMVLGPTTKGRWAYACSKAVDEFLGLSYWKERKVPVVIARLFNTVGPRQVGHYGMVIPRFIEQARKKQPLTVYGDGRQSRCFGYVTEVVEGMIGLMREPSAVGEVFNLGHDEEISIVKLAEKIRDRLNPGGPIRFVPYEEAYDAGFEDMPRRVPNLTKARKRIGYKPQIGIDGILDRIIAYNENATVQIPPHPPLSPKGGEGKRTRRKARS
jgi:UDP-glucose 4-epimerase